MENELYSLRKGFKKARRRKGISQAEVAKKMDVTLKTVMNWEQGISNPDLETIIEADSAARRFVEEVYGK